MAIHPRFIDDPDLVQQLDEAVALAADHLAALLPELAAPDHPLRTRWRRQLATDLCLPANGEAALVHGADAFGDPFALTDLPLPRAAAGYAVQWLGTDTLLDRASGEFLPVRSPQLQPLHASFAEAAAAARHWLQARRGTSEQYPLAVVPVGWDPQLERHVLIHGVLVETPSSIAG